MPNEHRFPCTLLTWLVQAKSDVANYPIVGSILKAMQVRHSRVSYSIQAGSDALRLFAAHLGLPRKEGQEEEGRTPTDH